MDAVSAEQHKEHGVAGEWKYQHLFSHSAIGALALFVLVSSYVC